MGGETHTIDDRKDSGKVIRVQRGIQRLIIALELLQKQPKVVRTVGSNCVSSRTVNNLRLSVVSSINACAFDLAHLSSRLVFYFFELRLLSGASSSSFDEFCQPKLWVFNRFRYSTDFSSATAVSNAGTISAGPKHIPRSTGCRTGGTRGFFLFAKLGEIRTLHQARVLTACASFFCL